MPSADDRSWGGDWSLGVRVWVERAGRAVLGKGRLELLEGIDRWHSISAAARQMGMSYRRAWLLVQDVNEAAGEPLVVAATGGSRGGGATLTPLGRRAVRLFRELDEGIRRSAASLLPGRVGEMEAEAVHVAAAASLEEVLGQLLTDYALRQPAVRVRTVFGASDELAGHVLAGAPADLFLTADPAPLHGLDRAGLVLAKSPNLLAENLLAAVGPADRAVPVRRPADLVRPDVGRVALADPGCPLGRYTQSYLDGLGLYDAVCGRAVRVDNSRSVVAAVRAGRADVGLVYASDAGRAPDLRLLFRAGRTSVAVRYTAAVLRAGRRSDGARALLDFLTSRSSAARWRACGFLLPRPAAASRQPHR